MELPGDARFGVVFLCLPDRVISKHKGFGAPPVAPVYPHTRCTTAPGYPPALNTSQEILQQLFFFTVNRECEKGRNGLNRQSRIGETETSGCRNFE